MTNSKTVFIVRRYETGQSAGTFATLEEARRLCKELNEQAQAYAYIVIHAIGRAKP
jgi:hypothetical protein